MTTHKRAFGIDPTKAETAASASHKRFVGSPALCGNKIRTSTSEIPNRSRAAWRGSGRNSDGSTASRITSVLARNALVQRRSRKVFETAMHRLLRHAAYSDTTIPNRLFQVSPPDGVGVPFRSSPLNVVTMGKEVRGIASAL